MNDVPNESFASEKILQGAIEGRLGQNDVGRLLDGLAADDRGDSARSSGTKHNDETESEAFQPAEPIAEGIEDRLSRLGFSELLRLNDFALWIMRDGARDAPEDVCWAYTERYAGKGGGAAGAPETAIFVLGRGNQPEIMRLTNGALLHVQAFDQAPDDAASVNYHGGHEIEDKGGMDAEIAIGSKLDDRAFASRLASELFAGVGETRRRVLFAAGKGEQQ